MSQTTTTINHTSPPAPPAKSFIAHAKLIGGLTLVSRVLGMARESASANYFGAGIVSSAFTVAFSIPNLFRKLFGEGALSAAFIPLYSSAIKEERERTAAAKLTAAGEAMAQPAALCAQSAVTTANDFAAASVNLLCVMLAVITVIGELAIWLTILLCPEMRPDRLLTLKFTAIMLPYVLLICGTAFLSSILQVHRRFGPPAFAPVLLNVMHIAVMVIGARFLGMNLHAHGQSQLVAQQTSLAYWLSSFVLVAGVLQVLILLPALRQVGFRLKWIRHFWTPPVKKMLMMSIPVALGAGVLQLSVLMDKGISLLLARGPDATGHMVDHFTFFGHSVRYPLEVGAAARLNWAQFLYQFPLGVFAIALATAIFPGLSADALEKDKTRFKAVMRQGIDATMFEGIAASVGLILVRYPAIKLLFQHGDVTPADTEWIAKSVLFYCSAIWAFSLLQIVNRAFYALHDTRTPLVMSVMNIAINLLVELPLLWVPGIGEAGMALGTCVSFAAQAVVMLWLLDRRIGGMNLKSLLPGVLKMMLAALLMTAACIGVQKLPFYPYGEHKRIWLAQLLIVMGVGGVVYCGVCELLGVGVLQHVMPKRKNSVSVPHKCDHSQTENEPYQK